MGNGVARGWEGRSYSLTTKNTTRVTMLRAVMSDILRRASCLDGDLRGGRAAEVSKQTMETLEWLTLRFQQ